MSHCCQPTNKMKQSKLMNGNNGMGGKAELEGPKSWLICHDVPLLASESLPNLLGGVWGECRTARLINVLLGCHKDLRHKRGGDDYD